MDALQFVQTPYSHSDGGTLAFNAERDDIDANAFARTRRVFWSCHELQTQTAAALRKIP